MVLLAVACTIKLNGVRDIARGQIPGLFGLTVIILVSIFTSWRMNRCQQDHLVHKDRRLRKIVEILNHLKIIKFHVWENTFEESVRHLRAEELESLREFLLLQAFQASGREISDIFVWMAVHELQ